MPNLVPQNQSRAIDLANNTTLLPAHLSGLPSVVGRIPVGTIFNRIGLKGREFHIFKGGIEEGVLQEKYADVIIVGAIPHVSRLYYQGAYTEGEAKAPHCYSIDGVIPAKDVKSPQSPTCQACPQNVVGSGAGSTDAVDAQGKRRACGFFRRLAVIFAGDTDGTVYQLDVKAQGLFDKKGDPQNNRYSFNEYVKKLAAANNGAGIDPGYIVTRLSFDSNVGVPKLYFQPIDFISEQEIAMVVSLVESGGVKPALDMTMNTVDLSGEVPQQASAPPQRVAAPIQRVQSQQEQVVEDDAVDAPTLRTAAPVAAPAAQVRQVVKPAARVVNRPGQVAQVAMPPEEAPARTVRQPAQAARTVAPSEIADATDKEVEDLLAQLND